MGVLHFFGMFCLLAATACLVIVSVGLPVWDRIYFLQVDLSSAATNGNSGLLRMGQWGLCVGSQCSKARLGYDLSLVSSNTSGLSEVTASIVHGLTYALILHPIAAGVSLIALLFAIGSNIVLGILGSLFAFFAFLVTIVALGIDLGLFITTRRRIDNIVSNTSSTSSQNFSSMFGPALWLVVAAAALQLLATFTVCFTHQSERRRRSRDVGNGAVADPYYGNGTNHMGEKPVGGKRWFWQKNRGATVY